jgi:UDP:flavonoid glycosyltransferase YjiC (YdhE family)
VRILFGFAGGYGHFEPLSPIARAALRRRHDVLFTGKPAMVDVVRRFGFECRSTGDGTGSAMTERRPLQRFDHERERVAFAGAFPTGIARRRAAGVIAIASEWRPDVIVCDEIDYGSKLAAERLGVPCASVIVLAAGGFVDEAARDAGVAPVREELGLPESGVEPALVAAPLPPRFRDPAQPLPRSTLWAQPAVLDPTAPVDPSPVPNGCVYVTLGTEFNRESGDLFERVLAGVRDLERPVLVSVGHGVDPAELGPRPAHVRVERYVSQSTVLPRAALIVSHGGSGSVIGALACGVPSIVLPMGADQGQNAARVHALAVGRVLDAVDASAADIAETARSVLDDEAMGQRVERFARECRSLAAPDAVLGAIELLGA